MYAFHTEETIGNGTARITGGSNKHIDLLLALFLDKVSQQTRHEAAAYILKGKRRTMEQLKRINILCHPDQRDIETECVINNLFQRIGRNILAKESICHAIGYLLKAECIDAIVKLLWQSFDCKGHEKPLVCGKPLYHGLFKSGFGGLFVGAIIFHCGIFLFTTESHRILYK